MLYTLVVKGENPYVKQAFGKKWYPVKAVRNAINEVGNVNQHN